MSETLFIRTEVCGTWGPTNFKGEELDLSDFDSCEPYSLHLSNQQYQDLMEWLGEAQRGPWACHNFKGDHLEWLLLTRADKVHHLSTSTTQIGNTTFCGVSEKEWRKKLSQLLRMARAAKRLGSNYFVGR